ncbi:MULTISPECIES: ATP cone domain-containing protein [Clostridium]|nr:MULTISPECIES: ATP cone domain-containing protein [Clostridium]MBX9184412.1 hypothetical protein [Clostridium sp. K04]MDU3523383.1 ATP cone domain-containing protein [Clostridium saudiense]MDU7455549.1 ATP cone domain-containing protein [Clostridium saudiense]MEE0726529.1 ATP cone domain-containing protein [Clostridium saudiense]
MRVVKRNGKFEDFQIQKLERSIKNSASDINIVFNNSDIKLLCNEIMKELSVACKDNDLTSSYEIVGVTLSVLKNNNFGKVINSYLGI